MGLVVEKSDVIHAVYELIVIEGPRLGGLRITASRAATGTVQPSFRRRSSSRRLASMRM